MLLALTLVAAACGDDDETDAVGGTPADDAAETDGATETDDGAATDGSAGDLATADDGDDDGSEAPCDATVPGSVATYGTFTPHSVTDPPNVSGSLVNGTETSAVFDVLFIYDFDTGEYVPHVAESISSNDDFTEWTLRLREGLTYSNGDPFDVDNLFASIDRFFEPGARNSSAGFLSLIESREKVDDHTAVFTLSQPWADFTFTFADEPGQVVNTRVIGDDVEAFGAQPPPEAGIGPYVVERNAAGEELVLRAREDYWAGPVCIERLRFVFVPGAAPTYEALRAGDFDMGMIRDAEVYAQIIDNGDAWLGDLQDAGIVILMNHTDDAPTADPRVRQAVALALDEQVLNERAFGGTLKTTRSLIHPDSRFWSDAVEEAPYDPERASQVVAELRAEGFDGRLRISGPLGSPTPEVLLAVEGMLEAVGFEVETIVAQDATLRVVQGDFDLATWGFSLGSAEYVSQLNVNFRSGLPSNRLRYASPEMDALLDQLLAAADDDARREVLAEINNVFVDAEEPMAVNLGALDVGVVLAPHLRGVVATQVAGQYLFHAAYIDESLR